MDTSDLDRRIASLDEAQLKYVFGRLLMQAQESESPLLTEEDVAAQVERDRLLLQEAAASLDLRPGGETAGRQEAAQALTAIAEAFPDYRQTIADALAELDAKRVTLDFGITAIILSPLIISAAGAILRPHVSWSNKTSSHTSAETKPSQSGSRTKTDQRVTEERRFELRFEGTPDLAKVIRAILPFLSE